jgi:hypothetical protein
MTIQLLIHLREHQKYSTVPLIWSWYSRHPDNLAVKENSPQF